MQENQLIIKKLDELKSIIHKDRKLSNLISGLDNCIDNINEIILKQPDLNPNDDLFTSKFELYQANQILLNQNYEKLITKPIGLLEIIQKAIADDFNIKDDLLTINSAIEKIKEFEKNKISKLIEENNSILEEIKELFKLISQSSVIDNNQIEKILIELNEIKMALIESETEKVKLIEEVTELDDYSEDELGVSDDIIEVNDDNLEDNSLDELDEISSGKTINININELQDSIKQIKRTQFDEDYLDMD